MSIPRKLIFADLEMALFTVTESMAAWARSAPLASLRLPSDPAEGAEPTEVPKRRAGRWAFKNLGTPLRYLLVDSTEDHLPARITSVSSAPFRNK